MYTPKQAMKIVRRLQNNNRTLPTKRKTDRTQRCNSHSKIGNAINCDLAITAAAVVYCLISSLMVMLYRMSRKPSKYIEESFAEQYGELTHLRSTLERKITHDTNNLNALISDKVADLQTAYNLKSPFPVEFAQGRYDG